MPRSVLHGWRRPPLADPRDPPADLPAFDGAALRRGAHLVGLPEGRPNLRPGFGFGDLLHAANTTVGDQCGAAARPHRQDQPAEGHPPSVPLSRIGLHGVSLPCHHQPGPAASP
ncbi:MAG: hypothetical protein M0C28_11795 [Candidatus Moduliflexus flocculans]|nr:hypothetical protein [Candidatus Moduliflexus flocculans]